jgi:hypothetical protein
MLSIVVSAVATAAALPCSLRGRARYGRAE